MLGTLRNLTANLVSRGFRKVSPATIVPSIQQHPPPFDIGQRELSSCSRSWTMLGGVSTSPSNSSLLPGPSILTGVGGVVGGGILICSRGMKIKGRVKRRCKDCYLIWIDGVLNNLCKTHPRHKQMLKTMYFVNRRILTHATSGFKRPW